MGVTTTIACVVLGIINRSVPAIHSAVSQRADDETSFRTTSVRMPIEGTPYTVVVTWDPSSAIARSAFTAAVEDSRAHTGERRGQLGRLEYGSERANVGIVDGASNPDAVTPLTEEELAVIEVFLAKFPEGGLTFEQVAQKMKVSQGNMPAADAEQITAAVLRPLIESIREYRNAQLQSAEKSN